MSVDFQGSYAWYVSLRSDNTHIIDNIQAYWMQYMASQMSSCRTAPAVSGVVMCSNNVQQ